MSAVIDIDSIISMLGTFVDGFSGRIELFFFTINDLISLFNINVTIPAWAGGDLTPFALMVGVGVPFYLTYQLVTWLLNIVT